MLNEELNRIKTLMGIEEQEDGVESTPEPVASVPSSGGGGSVGGGETGGGQGYPTVTKWDSGVKRGKANPVGNTKWDLGLTRGKANQLGVTKWESGVTRGKGNTLL
jgi:hypothetical protein